MGTKDLEGGFSLSRYTVGISTILGVPRIVLVCGETPGSRPKLVEGSVFEPTEFLPYTCVGIYAN